MALHKNVMGRLCCNDCQRNFEKKNNFYKFFHTNIHTFSPSPSVSYHYVPMQPYAQICTTRQQTQYSYTSYACGTGKVLNFVIVWEWHFIRICKYTCVFYFYHHIKKVLRQILRLWDRYIVLCTYISTFTCF